MNVPNLIRNMFDQFIVFTVVVVVFVYWFLKLYLVHTLSCIVKLQQFQPITCKDHHMLEVVGNLPMLPQIE